MFVLLYIFEVVSRLVNKLASCSLIYMGLKKEETKLSVLILYSFLLSHLPYEVTQEYLVSHLLWRKAFLLETSTTLW